MFCEQFGGVAVIKLGAEYSNNSSNAVSSPVIVKEKRKIIFQIKNEKKEKKEKKEKNEKKKKNEKNEKIRIVNRKKN